MSKESLNVVQIDHFVFSSLRRHHDSHERSKNSMFDRFLFFFVVANFDDIEETERTYSKSIDFLEITKNEIN